MTENLKPHCVSQAQPCRLSLMGLSPAAGRQEQLLEGKLLIQSPHGIRPMDCMLIEGAAGAPFQRLLTATIPSALAAMAMAALKPEAEIIYYHFDLFHVRVAEMLAAGHRLQNFQCRCQSDVPRDEPPPDLILTEFNRDGETGLACELIQQAHGALAKGGRLLAAINNAQDRWLRQQLEKKFGNLTLLAKTKNNLLYSVKRTGRPAETRADAAEGAAHYVMKTEVNFGLDRLTFQTCYGIFSAHGLDEGSRALLEVMTPPDPCASILALGCGWGAMGILAARRTGAARLVMIDANARAVEMARLNALALGHAQALVRHEADAESIQSGADDGAFDLVISNPPYGTDYRVAEMFVEAARRALRPGGRLFVVAKNNPRLVRRVREVFGNLEELRRRGYTILAAVREDGRRYE